MEKQLPQDRRRKNIDIAAMTFTCLYVDEDFGAVAPERLLINRHKGQGEAPWNYNGFATTTR